MNHSMNSLDRLTHLKIVVVAFVGAIAVAGVGIFAHTSLTSSDIAVAAQNAAPGARAQGYGPIVKAGQPVTYTRREGQTIR